MSVDPLFFLGSPYAELLTLLPLVSAAAVASKGALDYPLDTKAPYGRGRPRPPYVYASPATNVDPLGLIPTTWECMKSCWWRFFIPGIGPILWEICVWKCRHPAPEPPPPGTGELGGWFFKLIDELLRQGKYPPLVGPVRDWYCAIRDRDEVAKTCKEEYLALIHEIQSGYDAGDAAWIHCMNCATAIVGHIDLPIAPGVIQIACSEFERRISAEMSAKGQGKR